MTRTLDDFLADLDHALAAPGPGGEPDVARAVDLVMRRHLDHFAGYLAPPTATRLDTLRRDAKLTVLAGWWAPDFALGPHDHQLWLVAGVFAGAELNTFYERRPGGVVPTGSSVLAAGETLVMGPAGIHAIANRSTSWTGVVQAYGGDLFATARSAFDPDGLEKPL